LAEYVNFNPEHYGKGKVQRGGTTYTYHLIMPTFFFDNCNPHMQTITDDLVLRMYLATGGIIGTNSNSLTLTTSGISFHILEDNLNFDDYQMQLSHAMKSIVTDPMIQTHRLTYLSQTVAANGTLSLDLEKLQGDYSFLAIYPRYGSGANLGWGKMELYDFGDTTTIDLIDSSNVSLLANGTPFTLGYLRKEILPTMFENDFLRHQNVLIVPFGNPVKLLTTGEIDGNFKFWKHKNQLKFNFGAERVKLRIAAATSGTITSGSYRIRLINNRTKQWGETNLLAYNANAATVTAAVEALPICRENLLHFEPSAALANATYYEIYCNHNCDIDYSVYFLSSPEVPLATSAPANVTVTTSVTYYGSSGVYSANFNITIYAYQCRYLNLHDGTITVSDHSL
jgi:hypothetical protein